MNKYIILGDLHLGKGLSIGKPASGGAFNSRIQDQLNLLAWVLDKAIEHKASTIIVTGDVYEEPRPHPAIIHLFMLWLKKCEREQIKVHIIAGNHDILRSGAYTISALDIIPAIELSHATAYKNVTTIHFSDVSFTLVPYRDKRMYDADSPEQALDLLKKEFENEINTIPPTNLKVLIGHQAIEGSLFVGDEIDDMLNEIFCPTSIYKHYDYVWMGHIHKPQVLSQKPRVAHIGSMDRSDFHKNETDHDKIIVLIDPSSKEKFEEIILPTRPLKKISISVPEDKDTTDFIINEIFDIDKHSSLVDAIVKLEIQLEGTAPNTDRDKTVKFMTEKLGVHHVCNVSESRVFQPIKTTVLFDNNVSTITAINSFADTIVVDDEDEREEFRKLCIECYEDFKNGVI